MSDQTIENNAYSETPDLTPVKKFLKKHKRLLIAVIIICVIVPVYALLTASGRIAYPKWYLIGSFRLNKSSFEYFKDSGKNFCADFYGSYNLDRYDDPKLAASVRNITQNCRLGVAVWHHTFVVGDMLIFKTDNCAGLENTRGILYCENEIYQFDDFVYLYKCEPLGDGWYYYYVYDKGLYYYPSDKNTVIR